MRFLTASLTAAVGFAVLATGISACSDSTDDAGTAGAAGKATGTAGSSDDAGAAPTAGSTASGGGGASNGGGGGEAGAPACSFTSEACLGCITSKCTAQFAACSTSDPCAKGIGDLSVCACDGEKTTDECKSDFTTAGGDEAEALTTCYETNCSTTCQ